jgi:uncharacterized protein (DUF302 family)
MKYYFNKTIECSFEEAIKRITEALKIEGFGIISEIRMHEKFKEKLNVDFNKYTILGTCNPAFAYKAIQLEDKIGTMLPCNVLVQESTSENIEVAIVDPLASMMAIENPELVAIASEIQMKLKKVLEAV